MGVNRKRTQTLTIRLTEAEKAAIFDRAMKAGLSLTDYVVQSSLSAVINVAEDTKPIIRELKMLGNNINQIAVKVNSGALRSYNFCQVIENQRAILDAVLRIAKGG